MPETFRFSREACKACTAAWKDEETGRFRDFKFWQKQGFRVRGAWLEVDQ
jgi:hypothetical protein